MKDFTKLLALPASLLSLSISQCSAAQEVPWPYNLPRTVIYYPEHEAHVKRGLEAQERLRWQAPTAVRKMSDDAGEKFFLDYWEFEDMSAGRGAGQRSRPAVYEFANSSSTCKLLSPLAPHSSHDRVAIGLFGRDLWHRDFKCPSDTITCSDIGSDLCCNHGETCVNTSDGVGCCPEGNSCGDTVGGCDTNAGYSSCPDSDNGGCCIPGAKCLDGGCIFYGTETVTYTLPTATQTTGTINPTTSTTTTESEQQGTTVFVSSGYTTTVTISQGDDTVTTTVTEPTTIVVGPFGPLPTCSSSYYVCGKGCCPLGQGCAPDDSCPDLSDATTVTAVPPVRPTTEDTTTSTDTPISPADTSPTTTIASGCPTNYYMCSAVYLGGCCRVDRNCDSTSCPPTATAPVVTSGVTIGAGGGGQGGVSTGSCANQWSSCGADVGGGCCPTGFACGASCVATGNGQSSTVAREPPLGSAASAIGLERWFHAFLSVALLTAVGMLWL